MNILCLDEQPGQDCQGLSPTISLAPMTIEIGNERTDGHCHRGCTLCTEEAIPERCPGFRLDWLCQ